jgi:hypothetical protein
MRWNMMNDAFGCEENNVVPSGLGDNGGAVRWLKPPAI